MIKWHIEKRQVKNLNHFKDNPRKFTDKGMKDLADSIDKIGFCQPININLKGDVLSGNARLETLIKKGIKEVDVYVPDRELTEEEEREIVVRLNANTAGQWDYKILSNWDVASLKEWGMDVFRLENKTTKLDSKYVIKTESKIEKGDIYQLGNCFVKCGVDIDVLADLIIVNHNHLIHPKDDASLYLFGDFMPVGWDFQQNLVYILDKSISGKKYRVKHKNIIFATKGKPYFAKNNDDDILEEEKCDEDVFRGKAIDLMNKLVINSSQPKDIVLTDDNSVLLSCYEKNRVCYLVEKNEKICQSIIDNFELKTGEKACKMEK